MVVTRLPPVVFAGRREQSIVVPGRSGALHIWDGAWEEMLLTIECYLPYEQRTGVSSLQALAAWLTGAGWLTLSNRPERRFYAHLTDAVNLTAWVEGYEDRIFALPFWAEPFAYEAVPSLYIQAAPFEITNPGSVFAEPVIELAATGDVALTIGDKTLYIEGAPGQVMIDVPGGIVYSGGVNLTGKASGDWPLTIPTGVSAVSWTGSISQIRIQPNWRWL